MSESPDKRNIDTIGIDVVLSVLESGHSVELSATGYSMFPTFRPRDRVVVKPLFKGELPVRGSVVVFVNDGTTVQRYNGATAQTTFAKATAVNGRKGTTAQGAERRAQGAERRAQGTEHRAQGGDLRAQGSANRVLVMHRLVEIKNDDSGIPLFITRGDSGIASDKPWTQKQLLGVAVCYKRGKKEYQVNSFIPDDWRYTYNRRMLWVYSKLMRLRRMLSK